MIDMTARTMMRPLLRAGLVATVAAAAAAGGVRTATAGEEFLGDNGYAVSGFDPVAYFDERAAVPGDPAFSADYNGATFLFSTQAHLDAFVAAPQDFAPAYDGHCAFGAAQGAKVPGRPEYWAIVDDRLYLNVSAQAQRLFDRDRPGMIRDADENWPDLEPLPRADP